MNRLQRISVQMEMFPDEFPSVKTLNPLLPQLAQAAQEVYDAWEQDEEGYDEVYGGGGICQDIASAMAGVLSDVETYTPDNCGVGEQHVWVVAKFQEGVFEIDISPSVYETGGGYNWTKKSGVKFEPRHISVTKLSSNPDDFDNWVDN